MKDNEIIKALKKLELYGGFQAKITILIHNAIYLINRQKEDIERLEIELKTMQGAANSFKAEAERNKSGMMANAEVVKSVTNELKIAKSEAIKEFAEGFAKELSEFDMSSVGLPDYDRGYKDCMTAIEDTIDNLVEEMTEEI